MWSSTFSLKKLHSDVGSLHVIRRIVFFYCVFSFSFSFPIFVNQYSSLHFDRFMQRSFVSCHSSLTHDIALLSMQIAFMLLFRLDFWFIVSFVHQQLFRWMCLHEVLVLFLMLLHSGCCQSRLVFFFFLVCFTEPGIFAHLSCIMIHTVHHLPGNLSMCLISFALFISDPKFLVCFHVCF